MISIFSREFPFLLGQSLTIVFQNIEMKRTNFVGSVVVKPSQLEVSFDDETMESKKLVWKPTSEKKIILVKAVEKKMGSMKSPRGTPKK